MPKRKKYLCPDCKIEFDIMDLKYDEDEDEYYCPECRQWIKTKNKYQYLWLFTEDSWKER